MSDIEFNITCKMNERWAPHFLGMLKQMQRLGSVGSSRRVSIYADGDGDFRPKFEWGSMAAADPTLGSPNDDTLFDAG